MRTYSSTVTAAVPTAVVGASAVVIAAAVLALTGVPALAAAITVVFATIVVAATAMYLATVRLTVSESTVGIALGFWGRARWISVTDIASSTSENLRWPEVYGVGRLVKTRMTVRAGPALFITLRSGETISVSTP